MVKYCGNCGNQGTSRCVGCTTTAKPNVAPTHWQPRADAKDIDVSTSQEAKADSGKLELDLVPTQIARDIAQVRMYGTDKYGDPENWKRVELRRYVNALLRHTLAFLEDEDSVDEESGIEHYKHMACNMAFICEMKKGGKPKYKRVFIPARRFGSILDRMVLQAVLENHVNEFRKEVEAMTRADEDRR